MSISSLTESILDQVVSYLPQNEVYSLSQTSQRFYSIAIRKLYKNIIISKHSFLRTELWYIDSQWTVLSGLRGFLKRDDQNDYVLYLKLIKLIENIKKNPKIASLIKNVIIHDNVFSYKEPILEEFLQSLTKFATSLQSLDVQDESLQIDSIPSLKRIITSDLNFEFPAGQLESLTLNLHRYSEESITLETTRFEKLKELSLVDEETASLRILKMISEKGFPKFKLKRVSFNHVHGLHDYNTVSRALNVKYLENSIDLKELEELEMTIGCEEKGCGCLSVFLDDLAPKLLNLKKISFHEKTFHTDHYLTEEWDVNICRFLLNISSKLKFLSISHNPPLNGKLLNGFEGNYFRRRRLFEKVIPQLPSLETVSSPTLLQTASCYEIVVSDLLWNGCECKFCKEFLQYFDKYLMDHQYYDEDDAGFKDMISPRFFGFAGQELRNRMCTSLDLDLLSQAPFETHWNFHGYDSITCFNDVQCVFDEKFFDPLAICVSHFFLEPVKFLKSSLPNLKNVILNGVYFQIHGEKREITCVYDKEEHIK